MSVQVYVGAPGTGKTTLALQTFKVVLSPWGENGEIQVPVGEGNLSQALIACIKSGCKAVMVDEAEAYFMADKKLREGIAPLVQQTRHFGLSIGITTKRPAHVPRALFGCADTLYLFRVADPRDAMVFKGWIAPEELVKCPDHYYYKVERGILAPDGPFKFSLPEASEVG